MALYSTAYLLAEVRAILNEPNAMFWTDTELNDFIDWGARTISGITLCCPVTERIAVAAGTLIENGLWATSSTDFIKVERVTAVSNTGVTKNLQRLDIRNFGHGAGAWNVGTSGSDRPPKYYYVYGGESTYQPITYIFLWPVPLGIYALTTAYIYVYGYRAAASYVYDTTVFEIPDRLQGRLIDFVLACAYAKAGKFSLTRFHMSTFMQNAMMDRRDIHDAKRIVDSKDRFFIPDRTQQAQQGGK
jgi:hypothetical protein